MLGNNKCLLTPTNADWHPLYMRYPMPNNHIHIRDKELFAFNEDTSSSSRYYIYIHTYRSIAMAPTIKAAMPLANGEVEPFSDGLTVTADEVLFTAEDVGIEVEIV